MSIIDVQLPFDMRVWGPRLVHGLVIVSLLLILAEPTVYVSAAGGGDLGPPAQVEPSATPAVTDEPTVTATATESATSASEVTLTQPGETLTATATTTTDSTDTSTETPSTGPTLTATVGPSVTPTATATASPDSTRTSTETPNASPTLTATVEPSATATETASQVPTVAATTDAGDVDTSSAVSQLYLPIIGNATNSQGQGQVACTPTDTGGTVYLITKGELGRSRDFYTSSDPCWEDVADSFGVPFGGSEYGGITEFTIDPFEPINRAWVSIGHPDQYGGAVWRTDNLDASPPTWTQLLNESQIAAGIGGTNASVRRLQASQLVPGLVFVVANRNDTNDVWIGRSMDYGNTWSWSNTGYDAGDRSIGFALSHHDPNRLWVGVGNCTNCGKLLTSQDMGTTFQVLYNFGGWWNPADIHVPAHDNTNDERIYVVDGNSFHLWRSSNGGTSFTDVTGSQDVVGNFGAVISNDRNRQPMYYVHRECGGSWPWPWRLYSSDDEGSSWTEKYSTNNLSIVWMWPSTPSRLLAATPWNTNHNGSLAAYSPDGGNTWNMKGDGNWWSVFGRYSGGTGSCSGGSSTLVVDTEAIPAVPYPSTRAQWNGITKSGPNQALTTDNRENGIACYLCAQDSAGDPINTVNGSFDFTTVDLSVNTMAGPLVFQRTYASAVTNTFTSTLGYGWTHNHDTRLAVGSEIYGGQVIWFKAHGANEYRFDVITSTIAYTTYLPYPGVQATLTFTAPSTYTLITADQSTYVFTTTGKLIQWTDPQNHTWTYVYSPTTQLLTEITDTVSHRGLHLLYDSGQAGRLSGVRDHSGRQVSFSYSGAGDLITVTDTLNQDWTYSYTNHLFTQAFDPRSQSILQVDYDAQGRAWRQYDGVNPNPSVQIAYDVNGTTVITDARGNIETHVYNGLNTLTQGSRPLGEVISRTYDANFRPSGVRDPLNHPTTMTWSLNGANLAGITDALSQTTSLRYDSLNNLTQSVDARGFSTRLAYTGTLLTVITDTLNNASRYTYTTAADAPQPANLLKESTDPQGRTTSYQYDAIGQLVRITDTAGLVTAYGYDDLGRVITTTSLAGTTAEQITVNSFDAAGRLLQVIRNHTDASGAQNYAANGSVYNQITRYQYDPVGNQVAMTDTLGLVTLTQYDPNNRPLAITVTTFAGLVQDLTRMLYDAAGNTISTTVHAHAPSLAQTTVTGHNALNRPVTVTTNYVDGSFDPNFPDEDIVSVTTYDAAGNVLTVTEFHDTALARTSATSYDPLNRPISVTTNTGSAGPDRNITNLTRYDPNGNVISATAYVGVAGLEVTSLTQYDPLNRPVTTTTAAGTGLALTSVTAYNSAGQVTVVTEAFGTNQARTTRTEYDSAGRPITVTANHDGTGVAAPDRNVVQVTVYDAYGRRAANVERRVDSAGSATWITTTFEYNNLGQLLATTWPLTNGVFATTSQAYDALGRVVTQTDELGRLTVTGYDALGRPVTATANYVNGVFDPDFPDEDLVSVTTYDEAGNRVLVTDPKGIQTRFGYDRLGRLVMVVENDGGFDSQAPVTTTYGYDAAGNLLTITDGRGKVSTFTYDLLGRQVSAADPLLHTTVYTYNAAGSQVAMLDANGQETTYTYDRLGRLTGIDYPAGTADASFQYDLLSQRTEMTDGTGATTWGYDLAGRPLTITQAGIGAPLVYTYNSAGQRTSLLYPGAQTASYQYDLAGRLVGVTDWTEQSTDYAYDAAGQPLAAALPNGVTTSYGYDSAYRLATISHQTALATLGAYTYTVDASGNRTGVAEAQLIPIMGEVPRPYATRFSVASGAISAGGSRSSITSFAGGTAALAFTRSGLGTTTGIVDTVLGASTIAYTYDAFYRLTRADYADGSYFAYEYDAVGNRSIEVACWGGGSCMPITTTYSYDDANRLTTVDEQPYTWDANGNLLADGTFTYTYDAANRLLTATDGITTTGFIYSGLGDRVGQVVNGVPTTYTLDLATGLVQVLADGTYAYLYGQGRIAQFDGADFEYFLGDALGSVRQLADEAGQVTLARRYEPYGDVLQSAGTGETSYGFTAENFDEVTGLLYLRARLMQPATGRFVTRDTWAGEYTRPLSLNRWTFVEGNPVNYTDPSGFVVCNADANGQCVPENPRPMPLRPLPPARRLPKEGYVSLITYSETSNGSQPYETVRAVAWVAWNHVNDFGGDPFEAIEFTWGGWGDVPVSWHQLVVYYDKHVTETGDPLFNPGYSSPPRGWDNVYWLLSDEDVRRALADAYYDYTSPRCTNYKCANFRQIVTIVDNITSGADPISPVGDNNGLFAATIWGPLEEALAKQRLIYGPSIRAFLCSNNENGSSTYQFTYTTYLGGPGG